MLRGVFFFLIREAPFNSVFGSRNFWGTFYFVVIGGICGSAQGAISLLHFLFFFLREVILVGAAILFLSITGGTVYLGKLLGWGNDGSLMVSRPHRGGFLGFYPRDLWGASFGGL